MDASEPSIRDGDALSPLEAWHWTRDVEACEDEYGRVPVTMACVEVDEDGRTQNVRMAAIPLFRRALERLRRPEGGGFRGADCVRDALHRIRWGRPERGNEGEIRLVVQ